MLKNPGSKIKIWAKVIFILGLIGAILVGIGIAMALYTGSNLPVTINGEVSTVSMNIPGWACFLAGFLAFILTALSAYIPALFMAGFGELVQNSRKDHE